MTFGGMVRRFFFKTKEYLKSRDRGIIAHWNDIQSILDDYSIGHKRVLAALDACLLAATKDCPFYWRFSGKKLSEFPIMTKLDFIENRLAITNPLFVKSRVHVMSTSGSTGMPFTVVQDMDKRRRVIAELKFFGERAGYRSHEKIIFFRVRPKKNYWKMFWSNVWTLDVASMSDEKVEKLYHIQASRSLFATLAYASTYDILTRKWLQLGFTANPRVRAVFSGSEILTDEVRERCRFFWPNAKIVSRYSNQENGIIAQENEAAIGYEINWASYFVEILKLDTNLPASDGEVGRIVITDLYNRAFPMIRYDTGDLGAMLHIKGNWPVLSKVEGRQVNQLYDTKGSIVSPHLITNTFWGLHGVLQWQFIQEGPAFYRIRYIPIFKDQTDLGVFDVCLSSLRSVLGENAEFTLEKIDEIPCAASGKFKPIVQAINKPIRE